MELRVLPQRPPHCSSHLASPFTSPNSIRDPPKKAKSTAAFRCHCSSESDSNSASVRVPSADDGRRWFVSLLVASGLSMNNRADAVSTSRRALRSAKIPESEFTTLPNGLKYYDIKVGGGPKAVKGSRVAVHYVAKWKGITFMTSRQGLGVGGGTPYGFDVGQSERGNVLKGLDLGVEGMKVGGQRLLIIPPELAYGSKGVQEIPPNATIELDVELLSIKQSPFGTAVKLVEG
ncbi:peptidyl-prolyl cis-trans isomerase FKBP16-4, chloroplastic-like isoform X1 [Ananas comosus]|uniref:peptidylprolyl isomerase n=2 Tax=Ananas comosus TaxID=4615 RepID=A0A6P5FKB1_ANACO|nr:peptidyl-prolyl cis-trans isomerase FKBP16-4, chloroplastic-like isoform X1 [Ananas comosus]